MTKERRRKGNKGRNVSRTKGRKKIKEKTKK